MFEAHPFQSWATVLIGALCFAVLFGLAVSMGEALFDGSLRVTRAAVGIAVGAFLGYIGVALIVRREESEL